MTFKQIMEGVLSIKSEQYARDPKLEHHFAYGHIKWQRGEKFNYRLFAALLLIDKEAAKHYFQTTS